MCACSQVFCAHTHPVIACQVPKEGAKRKKKDNAQHRSISGTKRITSHVLTKTQRAGAATARLPHFSSSHQHSRGNPYTTEACSQHPTAPTKASKQYSSKRNFQLRSAQLKLKGDEFLAESPARNNPENAERATGCSRATRVSLPFILQLPSLKDLAKCLPVNRLYLMVQIAFIDVQPSDTHRLHAQKARRASKRSGDREKKGCLGCWSDASAVNQACRHQEHASYQKDGR